MRPRLLVVLAFVATLVAPAAAHAQQRPAQLLIGFTAAHMNFDSPDVLNTSWRGNLTFGIDFGLPLFPEDSPVQLRGEAMLVARGGHVDYGAFIEKVKLLYIDVASLIDWNIVPAAGDHGVHLLFGPSFGIRTSVASSINGIAIDTTGTYRRWDVGLALGTNFTVINKKLDVQALYIEGLQNIIINGSAKARNQTLLIMVLPTIWR